MQYKSAFGKASRTADQRHVTVSSHAFSYGSGSKIQGFLKEFESQVTRISRAESSRKKSVKSDISLIKRQLYSSRP